ncbi:ABC transporter ATP-binding protein [Gemmatimonas sp.]|uniref:ABC transporter ATP-binding protein n=1 Tax=Gemmatimonas sp. TaxID=1962908 RepID=UPI0025C4E9E1|nr:ABC transporter ATP-binding protein [Gemmatimonas sp.]MCA2989594.1 ABC transporter ATP-binding protein [Gemmatimonas sp.]
MSTARHGTPAIRMAGVIKTFGAVVANRDASLEVASGEIHALVGENGAGKSTLMRVLAGLYQPDGGTVEVNGRNVTGWKTTEAIAAGVGMVHQHFMLVPTLTVAENVVLGSEPLKGMTIDLHRAVVEVDALCRRCGLHVDPRARIADLSVGEAQRVEILKALYRGARVLILDEPTAVLSPPEVQELWGVLRTLREDGGTVVLITHKLDEVIAVSDHITVMRAGTTVSRFATKGVTPRDIARAMVGRDVNLHLDAVGAVRDSKAHGAAATGSAAAEPVLQVRSLRVRSDRGTPAVLDLSFDLRAGEILGIAGVEGNGQTELLEAIAGLREPQAGQVRLGTHDLTRLSVRERADRGLSHIPEDRHRRGLVLDYSIADNLILGRQHHFGGRGGLDQARIAMHAAEQVQRFDIRPPLATLPARALSGGNQQKIVIAREMGRAFSVLLAAQPTRGVDVGAIEFIHAQLRAARDAGKGILLVSADLPEVLALSDRIAVMYGGRFVAVLPAAGCTAEQLGPFMTGAAA